MLLWVTLSLGAGALALLYAFLQLCVFDHWRRRGVLGPKPKSLQGSFSLCDSSRSFADDINDIYKAYKGRDRFVGAFFMSRPCLLILDPLLIRDVFSSSFEHFHTNDYIEYVDLKKDPLYANNPGLLTGKQWVQQRELLSSALATQRLKVAYAAMQAICRKFSEYILLNSQLHNGVNAKDLALRFTSECIADCVLGVKAKSFFLKSLVEPIPISDKVSELNKVLPYQRLYFGLASLFPGLHRLYCPKWLTEERFFDDLIRQAFRMRLGSAEVRHDFKHYLMRLKDTQNLNNAELASTSMTIILEGSETTATGISACLLLLAREQGCQVRLREEIMTVMDLCGELSFERLNELPFLNACIYESLRIYPPYMFVSKACNHPHVFRNIRGREIPIKVGDSIMVPIYSIHHDERHYDQPEKFKPERFLPENGGLRRYTDAGVYLAFGEGPRKCLGMEFALVHMRAAIASVIQNFHVFPNPKTTSSNAVDPSTWLGSPKDGVWLDFEKIS